MNQVDIEWVVFATILLIILVVSFQSRARVFCQYLRVMTGIDLTAREVRKVYRLRGRPGVRDLFLDLLIREDLRDSPIITPDTPGEKPAAQVVEEDRVKRRRSP